MTTVIVTACLTVSAAVVMWPTRRGSRLRAVLPRAGGPALAPPVSGGRGWWRGAALPVSARMVAAGRAPAGRAATALPVLAAVVAAGVAAGPVAATVAGVYGVLAVRVATSRHAERLRWVHRHRLLDQLSAAAADLRAGLPAPAATTGAPRAGGTARSGERRGTRHVDERLVPSGVEGPGGGDPLRQRVRAATALAERTGAPLAELLDRIEADARAADRAQASAAAQAAGARATAWLLAALPAGGLALGYAIGADPLAVLLHTPVGAASALGAVALQVAGLAWTRRIMRAGEAVR